MPLFPSKPSNSYYDPIPQARKSTDYIALDAEHHGNGSHISSSSLQNDSPDADSDLDSLNGEQSSTSWSQRHDQRRKRKLRREPGFSPGNPKRWLRALVRHPFFPTKPLSIAIFILSFGVFAVAMTFSLKYILNPDKAPLPWRIYCSIPSQSTLPPMHPTPPLDEVFNVQLPNGTGPLSFARLTTPAFPPDNLDDLPPVGLFLGVFSIDSGIERRMLIRTTWASHLRSRYGANDADGGLGTSRTIVRFILGKPRAEWKRRVQLEAETYNDLVILPMDENMNSGKSHTYFTWAAENAWVPGPLPSQRNRKLSYANDSISPPAASPHDPRMNSSLSNWARPDFVLKADDDTFIMLAELESRLRVQFDDALKASPSENLTRHDEIIDARKTAITPATLSNSDPLIYFGYLVKNRFMGGEVYGLSWALTRWVATEPKIRSIMHGAEDKQTAKWMNLHPRAQEVRWASERCWIYDHPRAGTVYSHGFLFPSETSRVRASILSLLRPAASILGPTEANIGILPSPRTTFIPPNTDPKNMTVYTLPGQSPISSLYAQSSVSRFGTYYIFPLPGLTPAESIEALVEGSHMSKLVADGTETAAQAWHRRENYMQRYEGKRVGGTAVVHFIKRDEWFLETAMAFLNDGGPMGNRSLASISS